MATPITHIAIADRLYNQHFFNYRKNEFYIGTVFPDIRYLGDVTRDQTHLYNLTLRDVVDESDSFMAGVKFHCLTDEVRERFMVEQGMYGVLPETKWRGTYLKFLEDELFYPRVSTWAEIIRYFDSILPQKRAYPIPEAHLLKWRRSLQKYFATPPSDASRTAHIRDLGFSDEEINELHQQLELMRQIPQVVAIVQEFYNQLEDIFSTR